MTRTRGIFLALAAVFFVLAIGMHTASLLGPAGLLDFTRAPLLNTMVIISAVVISMSIILWLAAFFMTNRVKSEGAGTGELVGLYMLFQLVRRSPLWVNLVMMGFIVYLVAASKLIPAAPGELAERLRIFGGICSALSLHALLPLGTNTDHGLEGTDE